MFTVTEDTGFSNTAFFPGFLAGAHVEECFAVKEHFRAEGADYFLVFCFVDGADEGGGGVIRCAVRY